MFFARREAILELRLREAERQRRLSFWLWHKVAVPAGPIFTVIGGIPVLLAFRCFVTP